MSGYGYWDVFPNPETARQVDEDSAKALENAPSVVLREVGLVLASALTVAFGVNLLLMMLHI